MSDGPYPECSGIHATEWCGRCGASVVPDTDSLDAAWQEAEAALPAGWEIVHLMADPSGVWCAFAEPATGEELEERGPTPAAALRALAAKLRERAIGGTG